MRSRGSGNIGATNVLRTAGRGSAVLTLLLDATKGYLAVWLASWSSHDAPQTVALAAIAAVLGHLFPVFLRFKGGKGVSTVLGVFLYASPIPILIAAGSFACIVVVFRYVSLGSLVAAVVFPAVYFLLTYPGNSSWWLFFAVLVCPGLVIVKHHQNIQRLLAGTERKLGA